MPLLPAEPFVCPDDLLSADRAPADPADRWWVLHTRPRAEKALARHLFGDRTPFFLPLYAQRRRAGDRVRESHLPLFPGYLFLFGGDDARLSALKSNQVATTLPVVDQ